MPNIPSAIAEIARERGLYAISHSSGSGELITVRVYRRLGVFVVPAIEIEQAVDPAAMINGYFEKIEKPSCTAATP